MSAARTSHQNAHQEKHKTCRLHVLSRRTDAKDCSNVKKTEIIENDTSVAAGISAQGEQISCVCLRNRGETDVILIRVIKRQPRRWSAAQA